MQLTREEVPHAISVEVEELGREGRAREPLVETESQKQILVGKGGSRGEGDRCARAPEIEHLVGHPVFLSSSRQGRRSGAADERLPERLGLLMSIELVHGTRIPTTIDSQTDAPPRRLALEGRLSEVGRACRRRARRARRDDGLVQPSSRLDLGRAIETAAGLRSRA